MRWRRKFLMVFLSAVQSSAWAGSFMTPPVGNDVFTFSPVFEQRVFLFEGEPVRHRFFRLEGELTELSYPYLHAAMHAGYAVIDQFDDSVTGSGDLSGYYGGLSLKSLYNVNTLIGVGVYGQYQYGEARDAGAELASELRWHRLKTAAVTRFSFSESFGLGLGGGLMQYFAAQAGEGLRQGKFRDYTDRFALLFIDLSVDQGGWVSIEIEYGHGRQAKLGFQRYY